MQTPSTKLREHCSRRRAAMLQERADWMADWRTVSDYIEPSRGRFDGDGGTTTQSKKRSSNKIINSRATFNVRTATAGMSSHMTSKARPWFKLDTPDPAMTDMHDVKVWLDDTTQIVNDTLAKSNFYKAMPVMYTEDLMYGIAVMLIAENADEVVRFHPLTIGSYAVALSDAGRVDSLWRCYTKTARQLVEKYGRRDENGRMVPDGAKMPQNLVQAFEQRPDQLFTIESLTEPNPDARSGMGPLGVQAPEYRPYREVVWIQGTAADQHGVLAVNGHYEAPFVCIRFNPIGDSVYSKCPCLDALPDIKQLQFQEGEKLKLVGQISNPPMSIPDAMRNLGGASLLPGARNYLPMNQQGMKAEATYSPQPGALQWVMEDIREIEGRLDEWLYRDLFRMLDALGDQTGRTATEIAERKEEKASVLGPTLEIVTDEGLDPTIVRTFRLLERAGRIPAPPEALQNVSLKIEYTSILAQAMKAHGVSGIERTAAFVAQIAQFVGPSALDNFDGDAAIAQYNDRTGAPSIILRGREQVEEIRQGRAMQEQQQMMMAAAKPMSDAANAVKALDSAVPQEGSLGEGLAQMMSGQAA